ncbi:nitroreductase/quinone reductase family protein [Mycolicibacterium sp. XJ1819]
MERGIFGSPIVGVFNRGFVGLLNAPVIGRLVGRGIVVIRYVGRRSGRTFETPVGYRRFGDRVVINVLAPEKKTWWRNFLGGGAITLVDLDGADRAGHAVAERDEKGRVTVAVDLD